MAAMARKVEAAAPVAPPNIQEISRLLDEAEARKPVLLRRQMDIALKSVQDAASDREYQAVVAEMEANAREVERLKAAISGAALQQQEATAGQARAAREAHRGQMADLLDRSLGVAREFEALSADLVAKWRELVEIRRTVGRAWPGGVAPAGLALNAGTLAPLVVSEMWRVGGIDPVTGGHGSEHSGAPPFPGVKSPSLSLVNSPAAAQGLVDAIEECNRMAMALLSGEQPR